MSEHQYYEFAAIDRPLTHAEMAQLRAVSTRGEITPTGFVNHYHWGDLKADPADWMRRYFDAFVYTANWCSCRLALRVPLATFSRAELQAFAAGNMLTIERGDEHWIIDWSLDESEDYDRLGMEDGSGWMRRLVPLRDELLGGDLRPLYLGWLVSASELGDDMLEPEVPPGLSDLTPPQRALTEFIDVDPDLLAAAAAGSAPAPNDSAHADGMAAWPHGRMAGWLVAGGNGRHGEAHRSRQRPRGRTPDQVALYGLAEDARPVSCCISSPAQRGATARACGVGLGHASGASSRGACSTRGRAPPTARSVPPAADG